MVSFFLATFKILSSLMLGNIIMMCHGVCFLGSNFFGTLSFLDFLAVYLLCHIGEVLLHYFCKEVFNFLVFLFSFRHPYDLNVGMFKVVPEVPKPLLIFWILVSLFCSGWMFISSFCSKSSIWVLVSFPSLLVPGIFFFIITLHSLHTFLYFVAILNHFYEHPDYQCFDLCILIGWLSLHCLVLFVEFDLFIHLSHISLSWAPVTLKGVEP